MSKWWANICFSKYIEKFKICIDRKNMALTLTQTRVDLVIPQACLIRSRFLLSSIDIRHSCCISVV